MATTRFIDHLLTGIHSARPSAGSVPQGTLYGCTTHSLIYQSDGTSTWSTWFTGATGLTDPMTTRGDMITRNASNVTDRLPRGSAGTVLTSDGTDIGWSAPAAGGSWVWLQRQTASTSATLDFTSFISSTYETYKFIVQNLIPATNNQDLWMRMGTGGGPTYDTGTNYRHILHQDGTGGTFGQNANGATKIQCVHDVNNTSGYTACTEVLLYNPASSSLYKPVTFDGNTFSSDSNWYHNEGCGLYQSTTAVTAIRFMFASGNITSGTIDCYGLKHA